MPAVQFTRVAKAFGAVHAVDGLEIERVTA